MATVYDVNGNELIENASKDLAKLGNMKAPEWSVFVKTGPAKDGVPARDDWWYVRTAAVLRSIYRSKGPIGVQKLRVKYGSKKNRGHKPEKFYRASGKIIRVILQQLEKEGLIMKKEVGVHKGRVISPKGKSFLDKISSKIAGSKPKKEAVKEEKKEEVKTEKAKPVEKKLSSEDEKSQKSKISGKLETSTKSPTGLEKPGISQKDEKPKEEDKKKPVKEEKTEEKKETKEDKASQKNG